MGVLDMFDPEVIQVMKGFGPSDAEKQKAMNMGLLHAGLGVLAGNRGYGSSQALQNAIGMGGIHGLNAYDRQINDAEKDQMRQLQTAQMAHGLVKQQKMNQALQGMDVPPEVKAGLVDYKTYWDKMNPGKKWESGFDAQGRPVRGWAGPNGFEQVGGAEAKPIQWHNNGGKDIALDPYTGMPTGANMARTMSPDAVSSNALGWANLNFSKQQANKPTFNAELGGFIVPPADMKPGETRKVEGLQKPMTEAQGKAAGFADRMYAAEKILSDPKAQEVAGIGEYAVSGIPLVGDAAANAISSPQRQIYTQAQKDWVRAKLRKESGAVIGVDEEAAEIRTYFPQPGDSPEVIAQKAAARRTATEGISKEAGSAYKPQEMPKARSKQFSLDDGKKVIATLGDDGNYYVTRKGKKYRVEE